MYNVPKIGREYIFVQVSLIYFCLFKINNDQTKLKKGDKFKIGRVMT